MTIEQTNVVDFVAFSDSSKEVLLVIVDHLPWDENEGEHLLLLQNKLNTYLEFVEGGQLEAGFPKARGKEVIVKMTGTYPLSEQALKFFNLAKGRISELGFGLRFEPLRRDED
jgi:hypothetical protein